MYFACPSFLILHGLAKGYYNDLRLKKSVWALKQQQQKNVANIDRLADSFTQQIFAEHLLHARH